MTVDYKEINKVIPPLFAAAPNVASLLDQLSHELGTYYVLDNVLESYAFFSIDIRPYRKSLPSLGKAASEHFMFHPRVTDTALLFVMALWLKTIPSSVKLCHYIEDIVLTSDFSHRLRAHCFSTISSSSGPRMDGQFQHNLGTWIVFQILGCCLIR